MCWRFPGNGCPQGDSNPCLSLERAPSWAARRWGRLIYRAGEIVPHASILPYGSVRDCIISHITRQRETHALHQVHVRRWSVTFRYQLFVMDL